MEEAEKAGSEWTGKKLTFCSAGLDPARVKSLLARPLEASALDRRSSSNWPELKSVATDQVPKVCIQMKIH